MAHQLNANTPIASNPPPLCSYGECTRTAHQNTDGSYSSWCGKAHRDAARDENASASTSRDSGLCQNCGVKPVYVDSEHVHNFCGRTCATEFNSRSNNQTGFGRNSAVMAPGQSIQVNTIPVANCAFEGCLRSVHVSASGVKSQFCSDRHRHEAVVSGQAEACLLCMYYPKATVNGTESDFCSRRCYDDVLSATPILLDIPNGFKEFKDVKDLFELQWKGDGTLPPIHKIWKIYGNKSLNYDWSRYKHIVEQQSKTLGGNVQKRFYGTERVCNLGDDERNRELCDSNTCPLCNTIRSFFATSQPGRFGQGVYTMSTSSGSDKYAKSSTGSPLKAILLNDVVMGNIKELIADDPSLTQAPPGYDAVISEPTAAVYSKHATRPVYLIVYSQ